MSKPEINVTPLIDILLVLLIIFMVVTPVKPSRFETKIPSERKDDGAKPHPDTLVVQIDQLGRLMVNRDNTDALEDVTEYLKNVFTLRETNLNNERTVFIKAPKELDYGTVARVVDAVKMSGAAPISLQIDRLD